jgi:ankyrin repeat protein
MLTELQQEFFTAAQEGDVDKLSKLLGNDWELKDAENDNHERAIDIAVLNRQTEAVKFLVKGEGGNTLVLTAINAASIGNLEIFNLLLPFFGSHGKFSILSDAIYKGNLRAVKFLVEEVGVKITALHVEIAVEVRWFEGIKYLVEHGGEITEYAVRLNFSEIDNKLYPKIDNEFNTLESVKFLVEHGGVISELAIKAAIANGNIEAAKFLINKRDLDDAAASGDFEKVKFLVEHGGTINEATVVNAVTNGHLEVVKLLVEHGGKINDDAVYDAAYRGHFEVAKFLIEHGGKISESAVEYAVINGNLEAAKFLIDHGGTINEATVVNAVTNGHLEVVKLLVGDGGKITAEKVLNTLNCLPTRETLKFLGTINKALTEKDNWDIIKENHATFRAIDTDTEAKIPLITHHIWLTNINNPKELTEHMKSWAKNSKAKLNDKWEHYFWVNSKDALPETVKALSEAGFIFKEVSELGEIYLQNEYQKAVEERKFGLASDMLRYEILNKHGGLYFDTDYELVNDFSKLHYNSDFYVGNEPFGDLMLGNAIIGSKKDHIIITKILEHIKTWSNNETAPKLLNKCNNFDQTLYITGPFAISKAFIENSGEDGNVDLIIHPESIYSMHYLDDKKYNVATGLEVSDVKCENEYCNLTDEEGAPIILGYHYWANTWVKEEFGSNG